MPRFLLPLAFALTLFPALSQAQPTSTSPAVAKPSPTIAPETVQQMADRVMKETSAIRHLSVKRHVPTDVKTRSQIEQFLTKEIDTGAKPNEIAAANLYMRQLGMAPKNFDIKTAYVHVLGEQVAGFYNSQTKAFTTSSRVNHLELETVMAHELTHALQDQHFDLRRVKSGPRHNSDASLAASALVEGDATLVMSRYMTANPLRAFGMFASSMGTLMNGEADSAVLHQTPKILQQTLMFPYLSGLKFATNLQAHGGWASVSRAFSRPPISTQQVLHYDKYLANKTPEAVPVPDVLRVLGSGWKLLDHDVNGELGFSLIAGEYIDPDVASDAAKGWAGDRYAVYSGPRGAILVVQDSRWNDVASATYWNRIYVSRTRARFGSRATERRTPPLMVWNAAPDAVWLEQTGRRVIMLEGTPGTFDANRVLKAMHQQK